MSGGQGTGPGHGSARRPQRSGGGAGAGGTLPANGFTYIGSERSPATLNNGAPAPAPAHLHHLNNGSLRSLPDKKNNRNGVLCHPDNFQRNLDSRYSRKQENGYLRNSETVIGFGHASGERDYEREYSEPEYSVIPEGGYGRDCARACAHSNTFNC
ncbi:unnamed protein product [Chilo suppressalis]|uniref:Uncharacterized protein n=1 Tax=Chilo suppressalis TaxID=168631 RepID=A0ABN8B6J2_CHISP|nr:unnamed protein product [Chilo suppressalis]